MWTDSESGHEAGFRLLLGEASGPRPPPPRSWKQLLQNYQAWRSLRPLDCLQKHSSGGSPGPTPYQVRMAPPGTAPASHCPFPQASPVPLTPTSSWARCPGPDTAQKQSFTQAQGPPPSPAPQSPAHSRAPSTPVTCRQREGLLATGALSRPGLLPWAPPACAPRPRPAPSGAAGGQNSPGEATRGPDTQWVWGSWGI